ncbi:nitroreductase family protein [Microterricola viridarii]|uniref:Nitroreductase n=1 Tax=Microterricola viridarii TaxID=412690 RepID=A0A0Y0P790_9MICO|nr:nitroreductase family protein [Microterricola viridarii]AMB60099.1 nitroreductase [Microterricola viridarii]
MEFEGVVAGRRMVRRYTTEPVAPASVDRMLRNAVRAPNAGFTQGWAFLRLDEPEAVARFWQSTTPPLEGKGESSWLRGMRTAPVVIVPLSSKAAYVRRYAEGDKGWSEEEEPRWSVPYWHVDAGMAALLILQTAVDEGLGGCLFGVPAERVAAFRAAFDIPPEYEPVGAITIGHAEPSGTRGGSPSRRARRPIDEVVHRGRWGG